MTDPVQLQALIETSDLIVAGIGIFGVIIGSLISFFTTKRIEAKKTRRDMSIALYNEFHSERMNEVRSIAFNAMSSRPGETFESVHDTVNSATKASLSIFMHFLEKVAALDETKMVDKDLLKSLLGRYFNYWFKNAIDQLAPEPETSDWYDLLKTIRKLSNYQQ